jgi:hypothetical protein
LEQPTLLMCLDLADPSVQFDFGSHQAQLPLFSYINHDGLIEWQRYVVLPDTRSAKFTSTSTEVIRLLDEQSRLATPLPARHLVLRGMNPFEVPVDEDSYWTACDGFIGGDAFLRVGGPPIWLQDVKDPTCECGRGMNYLASIGYEGGNGGKGYISGSEPFYLGEFALYFFGCPDCLHVEVISQPV